MKIRIQIVVEHDELDEPITEEIACLCRGDLLPETMGLTLTEGKELLANIQEKMVKHQAEEYVGQQRHCQICGRQRAIRETIESFGAHSLASCKCTAPDFTLVPANPRRQRVSARWLLYCRKGVRQNCSTSRQSGLL
jgi:hypothetical protein